MKKLIALSLLLLSCWVGISYAVLDRECARKCNKESLGDCARHVLGFDMGIEPVSAACVHHLKERYGLNRASDILEGVDVCKERCHSTAYDSN